MLVKRSGLKVAYFRLSLKEPDRYNCVP